MARRLRVYEKFELKPWLDAIQAILTIGAILAGGIWFFLQRFDRPMVKVEHRITQRPLVGTPHHWLVVIEVRVTNVGKVAVQLDKGQMELVQINPPIPPGAVPTLKKEELKSLLLEPGESDQALFKTYDLPDVLRTVQIHSLYRVPPTFYKRNWQLLPRSQPDLYWNLLSVFDVGSPPTSVQTVSNEPLSSE